MLLSGKFPQIPDICPEFALNLQISLRRPVIHREMVAIIPASLWYLERPCVADLQVEPLDFKLCILLRLLT